MEKDELRKIMLSRLLACQDKAETSKIIVKKLMETKAFKEAEVILAFSPLKSEVDISQVLEDERVLLPFIEDDEMKFSKGKLQKSALGVMLSDSKQEVEYTKALILVPLLAYNSSNYRLGRGGGYYDRYIHKNRDRLYSIGLAYRVSFVEQLPIDEWDEKLDEIISGKTPLHKAMGHKALC